MKWEELENCKKRMELNILGNENISGENDILKSILTAVAFFILSIFAISIEEIIAENMEYWNWNETLMEIINFIIGVIIAIINAKALLSFMKIISSIIMKFSYKKVPKTYIQKMRVDIVEVQKNIYDMIAQFDEADNKNFIIQECITKIRAGKRIELEKLCLMDSNNLNKIKENLQ